MSKPPSFEHAYTAMRMLTTPWMRLKCLTLNTIDCFNNFKASKLNTLLC
jgi:hypothetical protein